MATTAIRLRGNSVRSMARAAARPAESRDEADRGIAAKAVKDYHVERSADWVVRLGDGTATLHQRMLWTYTGEMFAVDVTERALIRCLDRRHGAALLPGVAARRCKRCSTRRTIVVADPFMRTLAWWQEGIHMVVAAARGSAGAAALDGRRAMVTSKRNRPPARKMRRWPSARGHLACARRYRRSRDPTCRSSSRSRDAVARASDAWIVTVTLTYSDVRRRASSEADTATAIGAVIGRTGCASSPRVALHDLTDWIAPNRQTASCTRRHVVGAVQVLLLPAPARARAPPELWLAADACVTACKANTVAPSASSRSTSSSRTETGRPW